jgi:predicted ribosome quality control (RQC) complex YloA/Tae2 family protein
MFDAIALAAVADELAEQVLHGRVQEIVQLDALTFGFEIYANKKREYLLATARPDDARVHLVSYKLRGSGESPSPFLLILRKHAETRSSMPSAKAERTRPQNSLRPLCRRHLDACHRDDRQIL